MDMLEQSMSADDAMDMERFHFPMTFTIDNGRSLDGGSFIWQLQLLPGQHDLEEDELDEAAEFFDRASDDDGQDDEDVAAYQFDFDPESGHPTVETVQGQGNNLSDITVIMLNLWAHLLEVDFGTAHGDGGAVLVPASDAAVAGLEKQAFHATADGCDVVTGCAICLEDFEDGEEVTVMPCSRGHEFHHGCITEWLGQSNTCPLCRHALPTDVDDGP